MTEKQQIRAKALEIAALIIGSKPFTQNIKKEDIFKQHQEWSLMIERHILQAEPQAKTS